MLEQVCLRAIGMMVTASSDTQVGTESWKSAWRRLRGIPLMCMSARLFGEVKGVGSNSSQWCLVTR